MKFGICTSSEHADAVRSAGWDYIEVPAKELLGAAPVRSPLPVPAANMLVPPTLKITGPDVNGRELMEYLARVVDRAWSLGIRILVLGSGAARHIPEGFDRADAERQFPGFAHILTDMANKAGITVALEPLHRGECNFINTLAEALAYVKQVDHPNFRCLLDSYHFCMENEPLESVAGAVPYLAHVHVADKDGRVAPGESGSADYRELFRTLKGCGYDRMISVEALKFDVAARGPNVLQYLKDQWKVF